MRTLQNLDHNFWTRNARKLIKGSKDLDFSLVSNENFSEILLSSGLGLRPNEVGQKKRTVLSLLVVLLWVTLPKKLFCNTASALLQSSAHFTQC